MTSFDGREDRKWSIKSEIKALLFPNQKQENGHFLRASLRLPLFPLPPRPGCKENKNEKRDGIFERGDGEEKRPFR